MNIHDITKQIRAFADQIESTQVPAPVDPYAELKAAHAAGKAIEQRCANPESWIPCTTPSWGFAPDFYRIKPDAPPFQLPPPPPGMQWHREDGWQQGDLPPGTRPLCADETAQKTTDEYKIPGGWEAVKGLAGRVPYLPNDNFFRTTRPLVFTHEGKEWTWHRLGDPMPCDGERKVAILHRDQLDVYFESGANGCIFGREWLWADETIIGWRYAEPETREVELGPEDVPPGSVFRLKGRTEWFAPINVLQDGANFMGNATADQQFRPWEILAENYLINRSIPLTGKWNPDAWEPCHKQI